MVNLGRKKSGGKYKSPRKKKSYEIKGQNRVIHIGNDKRKSLRVKGGNKKIVMLSSKTVNILDPNTKKTQIAEIKNVLETPANRFFARQQIINKSAIIETTLGKAKVTNRPSQEGMINAILIKE